MDQTRVDKKMYEVSLVGSRKAGRLLTVRSKEWFRRAGSEQMAVKRKYERR
jgi:hypothetical protein